MEIIMRGSLEEMFKVMAAAVEQQQQKLEEHANRQRMYMEDYLAANGLLEETLAEIEAAKSPKSE